MNRLIKKALEVRKKAYAPFSNFRVGAALEAANGRVFLGCNIENSSFGLTICAERVALFKAISDGVKKFKRIAIVADTKEPCPPCGICRQALFEFAPDIEIIMANLRGKKKVAKLSVLLPQAFRLKNLLSGR